jgi:RHS repeat-associated protein
VLFDEPVVPAAGMELGSSITVARAGAAVEGSVTRISPWQLAWRPSESSAWILGGEYRLSIAGLVELGPEQKPVTSSLLPASFTHLASPGEKILVASPPPETPPRASSAFGNTTLFQGRLWVPELGLYYYRARWYDPMLVNFIERDPAGYADSPNLMQAFLLDPVNIRDPFGRTIVVLWYGKGSQYPMPEGMTQLGDMLKARARGRELRISTVFNTGETQEKTLVEQSKNFRPSPINLDVLLVSGVRKATSEKLDFLAEEIAIRQPRQRVVIVGHSEGADNGLDLAWKLQAYGVTVDLFVAIDLLTLPKAMLKDISWGLLPRPKIPANVRRFLAFVSSPTAEQVRKTSDPHHSGITNFRVAAGTEFQGVETVQEVHTEIDNNETVLRRVLQEIERVQ